MPTKKVSFNAWLTTARARQDFAALVEKWAVTKGRLTRDSVEQRALAYGLPAGTGAAAFDAYLADVG